MFSDRGRWLGLFNLPWPVDSTVKTWQLFMNGWVSWDAGLKWLGQRLIYVCVKRSWDPNFNKYMARNTKDGIQRLLLGNFNTSTLRQNGRHFADDIFKCIFLNKNVWISINISLKCVPTRQINNIPALVQRMAWRRPGDKPLSEPMIVILLTHICVTRLQWGNSMSPSDA